MERGHGRPLAQDLGEVRLGRGARLRLQPSDVMHRAILETGLYEVEETWVLWRLGRGGGTLVDVGANYGYYTCLWCAMREDNRAVAIEASPRCLAGLRENVVRSHVQEQVRVEAFAAGARQGVLPFELGPPEQTGWGGLVREGTNGQPRVEVRRLDDLVSPDELADGRSVVVKIDVEGAEAWVLEGASRLLSLGAITHVLFEEQTLRTEALGIAPGAARRLLEAYGYSVLTLGANALALAPGVSPPLDGLTLRLQFLREALRGPGSAKPVLKCGPSAAYVSPGQAPDYAATNRGSA